MAVKRRARTDEQKNARRQDIVNVAWKIYQARRYDEINISEIARAAGLAKGTVYLYFDTKEALFLAVEEEQLADWGDTINAGLKALAGSDDVAAVSSLFCKSLCSRPGLTRLFAILHVILEHNIDYETALRFKRMLLYRIASTGASIEACLSFLDKGQGAHVLFQVYMFVIGLQQLANPAPVIKEVIEQEPEMAVFDLDFAAECTSFMVTLLHGAKALSQDSDRT
jgi:AcrR family transcriptional regulator